jgi:hypothetical protein
MTCQEIIIWQSIGNIELFFNPFQVNKQSSFFVTSVELKRFSTNDLQRTCQCSTNQLGFRAMIMSYK